MKHATHTLYVIMGLSAMVFFFSLGAVVADVLWDIWAGGTWPQSQIFWSAIWVGIVAFGTMTWASYSADSED